MRVNLNTKIIDHTGEPFPGAEFVDVPVMKDGEEVLDGEGKPVMTKERKPLLARDLLITVYTNQEQGVPAPKMIERGALAMKCHTEEEWLELTAEQVAMTKELLGKIITAPVALLRMFELLDPEDKAIKDAMPN